MKYVYRIAFEEKLNDEDEEKLLEFLNDLYDKGIKFIDYEFGELRRFE